MTKLQTHFERFEYKYWVTERVAEQLERYIAPYLRCDDWVENGQRITSLYLDSPDNDFMTSHLESAPDRFKLRLRAYGDPPAEPAFLEIKRKVKAVTFKRRAVVPFALAEKILRGEPVPELQLRTAEEEATLAQFLYLMFTRRARPTVLVTYRRRAYKSVDPAEGARLTVDREVCYQPARGFTLQADPWGWIGLCGLGNYQPEAATLIEFKFRDRAPFWFEEITERLQLTRSSYSKYVSAMLYEDGGPEGLLGMDLEPLPAAYAARGW